jgi:hypothetical protein
MIAPNVSRKRLTFTRMRVQSARLRRTRFFQKRYLSVFVDALLN